MFAWQDLFFGQQVLSCLRAVAVASGLGFFTTYADPLRLAKEAYSSLSF